MVVKLWGQFEEGLVMMERKGKGFPVAQKSKIEAWPMLLEAFRSLGPLKWKGFSGREKLQT